LEEEGREEIRTNLQEEEGQEDLYHHPPQGQG
jgi:hypothetical protein